MNSPEKTLLLLCKQVNLCTNVVVTPETLHSLKDNNATADIVKSFWTILNVLSRHAAQKENLTINFDAYDKVIATKLYFGYLNYSDLEFFSLSEDDDKNAVLLLIAFSWLLIRHNVLDSLIKDKVINQIFDVEFIRENHSSVQKQDSETSSSQLQLNLTDKFNIVIRKMMKISYNLKDIAELINEKCRLSQKIQDETSSILNLPHMNLSELTLMKNYYTNNRKFCEADLQFIEQLNNTTSIIKSYEKWIEHRHEFVKWMTKIVEECESKSIMDIDNGELFKYISTVRYLNKNKIYLLETSKIINNNIFKNLISSNVGQNYGTNSCIETWDLQISEDLAKMTTDLSKKLKKVDSSMQGIINSVPQCIQI